MKVLRWLGLGFAALIVAGCGVAVVARFSDGPVGPFAGGELSSGAITEIPADWSSVSAVPSVELQLVEPTRSRTVWILVHEGAVYVPCGLPKFRLWKQWPHEAVADGRALLRVDGKRYRGQLVKQDDPSIRAVLSSQVAEKYGVGGEGAAGADDVWFFRFGPPQV